MFIVENLIVLIIIGFLTSGCATAIVAKNCSQAKDRPEYVCNKLGLFE